MMWIGKGIGRRHWVTAGLLGLVCGLLAHAQQGAYDWAGARELCPGVNHTRVQVEVPRPMNLNCLQIDTRTPGLSFYTTPRGETWEVNQAETVRKTTRQFMAEARAKGRPVAVAINADAWSPWAPVTWNQPTRPNLLGLAVSDGVLVSPGSGTPSLIVRQDGSVEMATTESGTDSAGVQTAVSGFAFVLKEGEVLPGREDLHPRTGVGLSKDRRWVYFLTIDGRQVASGGASCPELAVWLRHFGAHTGINMDGGGSTTMAWWDAQHEGPDKSVLLNAPVGNGRNPGAGERCNGNNLGVCYAAPESP